MRRVLCLMLFLTMISCGKAQLVAHLEFEGDLNDSAGTYNGETVGTIGYGSSQISGGSQCLDLTVDPAAASGNAINGVRLSGSGGDAGLLNEPETITVALWFKAGDPAGSTPYYDSFVSKFGTQSALSKGWGLRFNDSKTKVAFGYRLTDVANSYYPVGTSANLYDGNWHHIVGTYCSAAAFGGNTGRGRLYVDGVEIANRWQDAGGAIPGTGGDILIGVAEYLQDIGGTLYPFNKDGVYGFIDDVRLYDNFMTAVEIKDLYAQTSPLPIVTSQPLSVTANAGEEVSFAVEAENALGYAWYKTIDHTLGTPEDDVELGVTANVLTIASVSGADEGYYYCVVAGTSASVNSEMALLSLKREVAAWDFEDNLVDSIGSNDLYTSDVFDSNYVPSTSFVEGISAGTKAIDLSGDLKDTVFAGYNEALNADSFTISCWVKADSSLSGEYRTVFSTRHVSDAYGSEVYDGANPSMAGFVVYATSSNQWQFWIGDGSNWNYKVGNSAVESDVWTNVTVSFKALSRAGAALKGTQSIYVNGVLAGQKENATYMPNRYNQFCIGAQKNEWDNDSLRTQFAGDLDNVKVWNYALDPLTVAAIYTDQTGETVCVDSVGLEYDFDGNCIVDLADLAAFSTTWLNCRTFPDCFVD